MLNLMLLALFNIVMAIVMNNFDSSTSNATGLLKYVSDAQAGKTDEAIALTNGDLATCRATCDQDIIEVEDALALISNGGIDYLNQLRNSGIKATLTGLVVFIIMIAFNYLFMRMTIVTKVRRMADEINVMIDAINNRKGDLTTRIKTPTNLELKFIKDGINNFIATLQDVMKDVKNGSVILTDASENITAQLTDVEDATASISAEVVDGRNKAKDIKAEADTIKDEASAKKIDTGAKV